MILKIINNDFLKLIQANEKEFKYLKYFLNRKIRNHYFHPLVKRGFWNGEIKFIDKQNRIPIGLWFELDNFAKEHNFEFNIINFDELFNKNINFKDFKTWVDEFFKNNKIQPREYQIEAAYKILKFKRSVSEISTSGGKTLIIFIVFAYLFTNNFIKNFLIIVPNISLILQTLEKFLEYSNNKFIFSYQTLGGGNKKIKKVNLTISTYQTLVKINDEEFFNSIDSVCVDECHYTRSKSIQTILKKIKNYKLIFGLSGTTLLNKEQENKFADEFLLHSYLGPLITNIKFNDLKEKGYITPVKVYGLILDYLKKEEKKKLKEISENKFIEKSQVLAYERKIVIENKKRFLFLINLIKKLKNNTLVLFNNIKDSYGKKIYNYLIEELKNENVNIYYIDGSYDKNTRERIRKEVENSNNKSIIIASYGVFSTGIDITKIFNIIFTESFKSEIIIKQSIGRGMRLNKNKKILKIFDLVDDFSLNNFKNYILKHYNERKKIYNNEKYLLVEKKFIL